MKNTLFVLVILLVSACSAELVELPQEAPEMYETQIEGTIEGESFQWITSDLDWGYSFWEESTYYSGGKFIQKHDIYQFTHPTENYAICVNLVQPYQRGAIPWVNHTQPQSCDNWIELISKDGQERFTAKEVSGVITHVRKWRLSGYRTCYYIEGQLQGVFKSTADSTKELSLTACRFRLKMTRF